MATRPLHVQRTASDGTNASLEGDEADGFANTTAHLSLARRTSRWQFDGKARWMETAAEYDPSPAPRFVPADGDRRANGQSRLLLGSARFLGSERLTPWLALSSVETRRRHFAEGDWQSTVLGRRDTATLASNLTLGRQRFNATAELEAERFEQAAPATPFGDPNQRQRTLALGIAGEYQLHLPRLGLTTSIRRDFNDEFAHAFAYRVGITSLGQPRWFASVGRGVKNPTFVERFGYAPDAFVGNPDLRPETATGVEVGVEWRSRLGSLTLSAFDSALRRQIDGFFFDAERGAFTARNLRGKSERRGAELALSANVDACMGRARCVVRASYAYVHAENGEGMAELRRPRHLGETATAHPRERASARRRRRDRQWPCRRQRLLHLSRDAGDVARLPHPARQRGLRRLAQGASAPGGGTISSTPNTPPSSATPAQASRCWRRPRFPCRAMAGTVRRGRAPDQAGGRS